jgi:hypothetical protein
MAPDPTSREIWMSETHKAILEKANAAIVKGDFEGFLVFCTEDTKWTFVGEKTISGKAAPLGNGWRARTSNLRGLTFGI